MHSTVKGNDKTGSVTRIRSLTSEEALEVDEDVVATWAV
jgi:hypothetical protein